MISFPTSRCAQLLSLFPERELQVDEIKTILSRSEGVKSERGVKDCTDGSRGIHSHRPSLNYGPPTALFHPALARLKHRLERLDQLELEPEDYMLDTCHLLISEGCKFHPDESHREAAMRNLIDKLIGEKADGKKKLMATRRNRMLFGETQSGSSSNSRTRTDYMVTHLHKQP